MVLLYKNNGKSFKTIKNSKISGESKMVISKKPGSLKIPNSFRKTYRKIWKHDYPFNPEKLDSFLIKITQISG